MKTRFLHNGDTLVEKHISTGRNLVCLWSFVVLLCSVDDAALMRFGLAAVRVVHKCSPGESCKLSAAECDMHPAHPHTSFRLNEPAFHDSVGEFLRMHGPLEFFRVQTRPFVSSQHLWTFLNITIWKPKQTYFWGLLCRWTRAAWKPDNYWMHSETWWQSSTQGWELRTRSCSESWRNGSVHQHHLPSFLTIPLFIFQQFAYWFFKWHQSGLMINFIDYSAPASLA